MCNGRGEKAMDKLLQLGASRCLIYPPGDKPMLLLPPSSPPFQKHARPQTALVHQALWIRTSPISQSETPGTCEGSGRGLRLNQKS